MPFPLLVKCYHCRWKIKNWHAKNLRNKLGYFCFALWKNYGSYDLAQIFFSVWRWKVSFEMVFWLILVKNWPYKLKYFIGQIPASLIPPTPTPHLHSHNRSTEKPGLIKNKRILIKDISWFCKIFLLFSTHMLKLLQFKK